MRSNNTFRRNVLSTAAVVVAVSFPLMASAYDAARAAAASDPENASASSVVTRSPRKALRPELESAGARAAAASDPQNAAAYADVDAPLRLQEAPASTARARSAMVSDPENLASHSED